MQSDPAAKRSRSPAPLAAVTAWPGWCAAAAATRRPRRHNRHSCRCSTAASTDHRHRHEQHLLGQHSAVSAGRSVIPVQRLHLASIKQVRDADGHIRNVDQGDYITQGTVLGRRAERSVSSRNSIRRKPRWRKSNAEHERAKLSFDRMSVLYKAGAATQPDYDDTRAQESEHAGGSRQREGADCRGAARAQLLRTARAIRFLGAEAQCRSWHAGWAQRPTASRWPTRAR